jgi:hypothetical protein
MTLTVMMIHGEHFRAPAGKSAGPNASDNYLRRRLKAADGLEDPSWRVRPARRSTPLAHHRREPAGPATTCGPARLGVGWRHCPLLAPSVLAAELLCELLVFVSHLGRPPPRARFNLHLLLTSPAGRFHWRRHRSA